MSGLLARYGLPGAEIEARSLALVESLAGAALPNEPANRKIATMMLYASGDPSLASAIRIHPAAAEAGLAAIRSGCRVIADVRMVAVAIEGERLQRYGCQILCAIERPVPPAPTRAAAGVLDLAAQLNGAVAVIGNAPTALLALLDLVDAGRCRPALIIGTPVGMVAASESKLELIQRDVPYVTLLGTRGGSAIAAAALNGLLRSAESG